MLAHPSAMLLGAQLLQVLAWPFLGGSTVGRAFLGMIGMLAVGSAVLAVRRTPHVSRVVFVLGAPTIVFTLLEAVFADVDPIPRPVFWGGWLARPTSFEFWQGRPSRLHDRLRYSRDGADTGPWTIERLAP